MLKHKSIKKVMEYETIKEDKQRRTKLPTKEARQVLSDNSFTRYSNRVMAVLHEVFVHIIKRRDMISILIYSLGLFVSGGFAAKGMRFESLLSLVLAVIMSAGIGVKR